MANVKKQPISNKKKSSAGIKTNKALTVVEQGPNDGQIRKDGYGSEIMATATKYSNQIGKYADDLFASYKDMNVSLGKQIKDLSKLPALSKIASIIKEYNPKNLIARIEENVLGGVNIRSIYEKGMKLYKDGKQVYNDFKKDALGALEKYGSNLNLAGVNVGEMIRTGKATYNDVRAIQQIVKNNDWGGLAGVVKGLDSLGNNHLSGYLKEIVDVQAHTAFLGKALQDAQELGLLSKKEVSETFKLAFNELNTGHVGNQLVANLFSNSARESDIGSMENIVSWLGGKQVLANNPTAVETALEYFNLTPGFTEADAATLRKRLIDLLDSINPNWYKDTFNGKEVTRLDAFTKLSMGSKKLLAMEITGQRSFKLEMMIAGVYPRNDIKAIVNRDFRDVNLTI